MNQATSVRLGMPNLAALGAALAGGAAVIGSMGPWVVVTVPFVGTITYSGTDGTNDGMYSLIAGAIAASLMLVVALFPIDLWIRQLLAVFSLVAFVVVVVVVLLDWESADDNIAGMFLISQDLLSVAWGLYVTLAAGAAGFLLSLVTLVTLSRSGTGSG